jgi:TatA/E family protein of Tat protein translocase
MGIIEPGHLVLILLIALLVLGPGKLGNLGRQLGRGVREFRDATEGKSSPPPPALSSGRYCTKCGAALASDARFCTACGTPVAGAA